MQLNAVFKFVAKNPPMALVAGGILLKLVVFIFSPIPNMAVTSLDSTGDLCIGAGIGLQILWMLFRYGLPR